tara:strand:- start:1511 stop:1771 length:261 start_codon:yes stop_codon:yes gene_type:complete
MIEQDESPRVLKSRVLRAAPVEDAGTDTNIGEVIAKAISAMKPAQVTVTPEISFNAPKSATAFELEVTSRDSDRRIRTMTIRAIKE